MQLMNHGKYKSSNIQSNNTKVNITKRSSGTNMIIILDTFIKPLLKLRQRYKNNKNEELMKFMTKAIHKAMITWIKTEPNLRPEIIEQINKDLNGSEEIDEQNWKKIVNEQAFIRLFKNNIPEEVKSKINKLKLPNILNLFIKCTSSYNRRNN